ncbi:MAG: DHH family phosphoesterase [Candidatus Paceibacterota bacterium]
MEIKNLRQAAKRILEAVKNNEKIIVYGDADLDGVSSVIILEETLKNLGGNVVKIYFPDREKDGYGVNETALKQLKKFSPALLISVDLGIGNLKEAKLAKKLGFKMIIVDHHEVLDKVPAAEVVVDPKQKGDKYPFKAFAAAGIVFKLAELLLENKMADNLRNNFLELTALATIADMMPKQEENEVFIKEGLKSMENSWRPAIKVFLDTEQEYTNFDQKIYKFISILNVRDSEKDLPVSFRLLTIHSPTECEELIKDLLEKREIKRGKIEEIARQIEEKIIQGSDESIIFEGNPEWDFSLISLVASLLCQKYKKPTFIYKKLKKEASGTVRAPAGVNSVELMKKCRKCLLTFGGHPPASGFRLKNENLEKFHQCLLKNFKKP